MQVSFITGSGYTNLQWFALQCALADPWLHALVMFGFVITTSFIKSKSGDQAPRGKSGYFIATPRPSNRCATVLLCLAAMVFWCGCIPLRFTTSPGASGTIVDLVFFLF